MSGTHWQDDPPEDPRDDWLAEPDPGDWDEPSARAGEEEGSGRPTRRSDGGGGSGAVSPEVRRRRQILALVVGVLVLVVIVAVVFATRGGGSKPPTAVTTPPPPNVTSPSPPATPPATPPASGPTGASGQSVANVTLPAGGSLRSGDSGPEVVKLQKALAALGEKVGNPDGTFGPATAAAVVAFQKAHGLSPDGIVGAATAKKLNQALAASG